MTFVIDLHDAQKNKLLNWKLFHFIIIIVSGFNFECHFLPKITFLTPCLLRYNSTIMLKLMLELLPALLWGLLNVTGGIWLIQAAFNLRRDEQTLTGLACGFVVQIWLARWLGIFLPPLFAFWGAAILLFISGLTLIFYRRGRSFWRFFPLAPSDWLLLLLGIYLFSGIERGQIGRAHV